MSKTFKILSTIVGVLLVGFLIVLLLSSNLTQKPPQETSQKEDNHVEKQEIFEEAEDVDELEIEVLEEGEGRKAESGDTLKVHYEGKLLNDEIFDSSYDRDTPFEFELGAGQVIEGWDEGLKGAKEGEKRLITIPSEKGYGEQGSANIPPNAGLIFETELIEIE